MIMSEEQKESAYDVFWCLVLGSLIVGICGMTGCLAHAEETPDGYEVEALADAIFHAEGSQSKPYGIMLEGCQASTPKTCRKYAINTIRNNIVRYNRLPSPPSFVTYLAGIYAPPHVHYLNINFEKNVRWFLAHPKAVNHE